MVGIVLSLGARRRLSSRDEQDLAPGLRLGHLEGLRALETERNAHTPDENVGVDELVAAALTLALMALRFCGHEES